MKPPRLTVCLPVYNGAAHLAAALEGLAAQTFKDFTVLVSDNASTDATPEILARCAAQDSRIQVVRQESNIGVKMNFQFLLDRAETDYVIFLAHDDKWSPGYLEALMRVAAARPQAELIVPKVQIDFPHGRPPVEIQPPR